MSSPLPRRPSLAAVFAFYAALAVAWTWPLATHLASRVAFDPGDPFLNTWILWWNAQAVPFTEAWWNPPIFYPMRGALALSEHLAGLTPITTPLLLLGGSPALAYNVSLLLSCALSGFFTYLLLRRLGGSPLAALCGGVAYAIAPFRAGQLSHLQVLTSQWLPLMLTGLHGYLDSGRRRWLALFGVAWILQALANGYYLLFAPALLAAWVAWFVLRPRRWRALADIAAAAAIASLPLVPVLLTYLRVHHAQLLSRSRGEILNFSGHLASFLKPASMLAIWPENPLPAVEDFLFPGLTVVLLVAAGLLRRRSAVFVFYVLAALLMAALTLGPAAPGEGALGWLRPYHWLMLLPGFDGVRVPVRFGMLMALCLSVAAGLALEALLAWRPRLAIPLGCLVLAGLAIDGAIEPLGGTPPPGRVALPSLPGAAVLELPPDDTSVSVGAMFRSISHRLPLVNGYSGHIPVHYDIFSQSLRRDDPSAIVELARGRPLLILVAERNDPAGDFRRLVESIPGIARGDATGAGTAYVLPAQPRDRLPRGSTPHAFTAQALPREHAVLDLGARHTVRTLEFALRRHYPDFGRRFAVETSDNGRDWAGVWDGWTGGAAVAGALEDAQRVPVRIGLPDVEARYLRIHPAPDWLVSELRVLGP